MQGNSADFRAVEADIPKRPFIELREFLDCGPVAPPRGVSPDQLSEVHSQVLSELWVRGVRPHASSLSMPQSTKFNEIDE
jgi:hypothetical protein